MRHSSKGFSPAGIFPLTVKTVNRYYSPFRGYSGTKPKSPGNPQAVFARIFHLNRCFGVRTVFNIVSNDEIGVKV